MQKIVFIIAKKDVNGRKRSLDLVLSYLKDNLQMNYTRWLSQNGSPARIGRSSYQQIVLPAIQEINAAIARYIPGFEAFQIVQKPWRRDKFHKYILRHQDVQIIESEKQFFIEVKFGTNVGTEQNRA